MTDPARGPTTEAPKRRRRHAVKIREAVLDHIPRPHTWHVIECSCGWSSALHGGKEGRKSAQAAYDAHKRSRKRRD